METFLFSLSSSSCFLHLFSRSAISATDWMTGTTVPMAGSSSVSRVCFLRPQTWLSWLLHIHRRCSLYVSASKSLLFGWRGSRAGFVSHQGLYLSLCSGVTPTRALGTRYNAEEQSLVSCVQSKGPSPCPFSLVPLKILFL